MVSLSEYIARAGRARRSSINRMTLGARRAIDKDVGEVRTIRSIGLRAASVALPSGIDLDDRAARMNDFWPVMISSIMPSAKCSCSGSPLMFWKGKAAIDGLLDDAHGIAAIALLRFQEFER